MITNLQIFQESIRQLSWQSWDEDKRNKCVQLRTYVLGVITIFLLRLLTLTWFWLFWSLKRCLVKTPSPGCIYKHEPDLSPHLCVGGDRHPAFSCNFTLPNNLVASRMLLMSMQALYFIFLFSCSFYVFLYVKHLVCWLPYSTEL